MSGGRLKPEQRTLDMDVGTFINITGIRGWSSFTLESMSMEFSVSHEAPSRKRPCT